MASALLPHGGRGRWHVLAATGAFLVVDWLARARSWPLPVLGLLDEFAHLLTAWLVLAAALPTRFRTRTVVGWALAGSVLIDLDHVPLYLSGGHFAVAGGRPPTHGVVTLAVLLAVCLPARHRGRPAGMLLGVLLHFLRDVATGPGLPLLWPLAYGPVRVPHGPYVAVVLAAAVLALCRPVSSTDSGTRRRPSRPGSRRRRAQGQRGQSDPGR